MRARLFSGLRNADGDPKLAKWRPGDPRSFVLDVNVDIGHDQGEGRDEFSFTVCTPHRLEDAWARARAGDMSVRSMWTDGEVTSMHGVFVMEEWDLEVLKAKIERLCDETHGRDWIAVAAQLNGPLRWHPDDSLDD